MYIYAVKSLAFLLYPFSLIYGFIMAVRNFLYDSGMKKSKDFPVRTICVGNLSVGGTGKTPHIEYLIRLLKDDLKIATLSRGYGRKTSGYLLANENSNSLEIGDEPRQYKTKYPSILVAVDANRARGIDNLYNQFRDLDLILLDDAFQHRQVKPELSIVLTDYSKMYYDDFALPSGTLREFKSAIKRADVVIITKSPRNLSPYDRRNLEINIGPKSWQKVFFSHIKYLNFIGINSTAKAQLPPEEVKSNQTSVLIFSGIANSSPLEDYIRTLTTKVTKVDFSDHHQYSESDIARIIKNYELLEGSNKIIVTTEKDFARLDKVELINKFENIPLYYAPIEIEFSEKDKEEFNQIINTYARRNKIYVGVYKEKS